MQLVSDEDRYYSGAAGACGAAGAILGTGMGGGEVLSAVAGGLAGAASAGMAGTTLAIFSGPLGSIILGASRKEESGIVSLDCWKQVLHDQSSEPSDGRLLRDVVFDPRIREVSLISSDSPKIIIKNIWNEQFLVECVALQFAHATPLV